jgi:NADH-quinone oxidoreductase subunit I
MLAGMRDPVGSTRCLACERSFFGYRIPDTAYRIAHTAFRAPLLDRFYATEYDRFMIRPFLVGFATTLKHFFKKKITVNYPDQKVPVFPKYRGKQVLMRDENGLEKCVACGLCAVACPADAIYLEAAENDGSVQAGPRYAKVYQIHKTRCIFCGYCEEACPVSAIFMGKDYELAVYSSKDFIWDKADLLVPAK